MASAIVLETGRWEDPKDPEEVLDYVIDATKPLAQAGEDSIDTYTLDIVENTSDNPLVIDSHSDSNGKITIWFSGGKLDTFYAVHCHIITTQSRQIEQTVELLVAGR